MTDRMYDPVVRLGGMWDSYMQILYQSCRAGGLPQIVCVS